MKKNQKLLKYNENILDEKRLNIINQKINISNNHRVNTSNNQQKEYRQIERVQTKKINKENEISSKLL